MKSLTRKKRKRKQWDTKEHLLWIKEVYGDKTFSGGDEQLAAARAERNLTTDEHR